MLSVYPACFFKDEDGYTVIFPDLCWTSTCGATLDEAVASAEDCLAGYLYAAKRNGDEVPAPSPMDAVSVERVARELGMPAGEEAFVSLVSVNVEEYAKAHFERSVKKTLTIPAWLNEAAIEAGINFSKTLQDALKRQLAAR